MRLSSGGGMLGSLTRPSSDSFDRHCRRRRRQPLHRRTAAGSLPAHAPSVDAVAGVTTTVTEVDLNNRLPLQLM